MLGYPTTPPPPPGARQLTARPTDPQGLGQPRGGWGSPPPKAPKIVAHPSGSHIGWRRPPCMAHRCESHSTCMAHTSASQSACMVHRCDS